MDVVLLAFLAVGVMAHLMHKGAKYLGDVEARREID